MTTISPMGLDAALRRAYSTRDAASLAALYAADATIEIVDAEHTPSQPPAERPRSHPRPLEDVFARDMTHDVETSPSDDASAIAALRLRGRHARRVRRDRQAPRRPHRPRARCPSLGRVM